MSFVFLESYMPQRGFTTQNNIPVMMRSQGMFIMTVSTCYDKYFFLFIIPHCRNRRAQAILSHDPILRQSERRDIIRRTFVLSIPETRQQELISIMACPRIIGCATIKIHIFLSRNDKFQMTTVFQIRYLSLHCDRNIFLRNVLHIT